MKLKSDIRIREPAVISFLYLLHLVVVVAADLALTPRRNRHFSDAGRQKATANTGFT